MNLINLMKRYPLKVEILVLLCFKLFLFSCCSWLVLVHDPNRTSLSFLFVLSFFFFPFLSGGCHLGKKLPLYLFYFFLVSLCFKP